MQTLIFFLECIKKGRKDWCGTGWLHVFQVLEALGGLTLPTRMTHNVEKERGDRSEDSR